MRILGIIYLLGIMWFTLFGKLTISGEQDNGIIHKFIAGLLFGFVITIVFGLPLLGIVFLLGLY